MQLSKKKKHPILFFDSSKLVLHLLMGQILKQGKKNKVTHLMLFFFFSFYQTFSFLFSEELELLIEKDFNLPYSLGKKHSSNKVYFFPRPITEQANWKFFFKSFANHFKKEKKGQELYNLLVIEFLNLIFCDSDLFIFKEIDQFLTHANEYRMFIHFRWTRKRLKKLPRRLRFIKKKRFRQFTHIYNKFNSKAFHKIARFYLKPKSRKQKLIGFRLNKAYKLL